MKRLYLLIGLGIVCAILLLIFVTLLFSQHTSPTPNINTVKYIPTSAVISPTPLSYPTPDLVFPTEPTQKWKLYKDYKNKFELSYPTTWNFDVNKEGSINIDNGKVSWDLSLYDAGAASDITYLGIRSVPSWMECGEGENLCAMLPDTAPYKLFGYPVTKYSQFVRSTNQVYLVEFLLHQKNMNSPGFGWVDPIPVNFPELKNKVDQTKFYVLKYNLIPGFDSRDLRSVNDLKEGINPYMSTLDDITKSIKFVK